jgi:hypothetical protein
MIFEQDVIEFQQQNDRPSMGQVLSVRELDKNRPLAYQEDLLTGLDQIHNFGTHSVQQTGI